jgi:hypothetical protein
MGEWEACQWRHLIAICNKLDSRRTRRECGWPFQCRVQVQVQAQVPGTPEPVGFFQVRAHFTSARPPVTTYYQGTKILNLSA